MKYAVFTVSIPDYTPEVAVREVKDAGYDGIEWRVIDQEQAPAGRGFWAANKATLPLTTLAERATDYRKLSDDAGLETPSIGTYVSCDNLADVELAMTGARALGVSQLRVRVPGYDGQAPFQPIWATARQQYRDVADLAKKHSLKAVLELHHRSITPSASSARLFLDGLDPDHVGVIHDAGNMVHEGYETHRLSLEMLGPYLAHVHVKNARWFPKVQDADGTMVWMCDWAPVHRGIIDMRALFKAMKQVGYDGWVGLEDFSTDVPIEQRLRANLTYLRDVAENA